MRGWAGGWGKADKERWVGGWVGGWKTTYPVAALNKDLGRVKKLPLGVILGASVPFLFLLFLLLLFPLLVVREGVGIVNFQVVFVQKLEGLRE